VVPIPATLPLEHAACLPVAGLAAWCALACETTTGPGSRVLLMGTGGLSTIALQIARALGAQVAVVSASDAKLDRMRALGADFTANRRREGWGGLVRAWSGEGVDTVLETGGDGTFDQSVTATRDEGCIALLGNQGPGLRSTRLTDVLMRRIRVQGVFVGCRVELERYLRFVEAYRLAPIIDRVFDGLANARHAFAHLLAGQHLGKIVVRVSG
jgi:NADPH:quinone reductase-like Zn-dependent oxidoreductase